MKLKLRRGLGEEDFRLMFVCSFSSFIQGKKGVGIS
jgi:hypothetical protein